MRWLRLLIYIFSALVSVEAVGLTEYEIHKKYRLGEKYQAAFDAYRTGDLKSAYSGFFDLSKSGNPAAQVYLAELLVKGRGVKRDINTAIDWYKKAGELGLGEAWYMLGYLYYSGEHIEKNFQLSFLPFKKGAELGEYRSMYHLAEAYQHGFGVGRNFQKAEQWYRKASYGISWAYYGLGSLYQSNQNPSKDNRKAYANYLKAAKLDVEIAQFHLGRLYMSGDGVEKNLVEAHMWLTIAANNGVIEADDEIDKLIKIMTPDQIVRAEELYSDCAYRPSPFKCGSVNE